VPASPRIADRYSRAAASALRPSNPRSLGWLTACAKSRSSRSSTRSRICSRQYVSAINCSTISLDPDPDPLFATGSSSALDNTVPPALLQNQWPAFCGVAQTTGDDPPSTLIALPVTKDALGEARNTTTSATSAASASRPSATPSPESRQNCSSE